MHKDAAEIVNTLTFLNPYKSIKSLEPISLPGLVVLTGVNGSGKTHLLTAIKSGLVRSSVAPNPDEDIRIYDSSNIIPLDKGVFDSYSHMSQRYNLFEHMKSFREANYPALREEVRSVGVPESYASSLDKLGKLTKELFLEGFEDKGQAEANWGRYQFSLKRHAEMIMNQTFHLNGDEDWRKRMRRIAAESPDSFLFSSSRDFHGNAALLWGTIDPFQQEFAQVFVTYRRLLHENAMYKSFPPPINEYNEYLEPHEFIEAYGAPPWEFVNQILEASHLSFKVDSPPLHENSPYEPKLTKIATGIEMRFQDLSSGEKVLMSFALCLYNAKENRQEKTFPTLLLLDEVDAPLHPSMAVSLLATIKNILVDDRHVAVIMTTHSPSTVALAPDESIYVMDLSASRILKVSKSEALSILTSGVPTLSIFFDGRRQVFVESHSDARLYDSLYQRYKHVLKSERSLTFIEVGRTSSDGHEKNAGCDQVIRLVDTLSNSGNKSVFGLVDWDGERPSNDRVHVLSPGLRDGIENLLFDPVLLMTLLLRENLGFLIEKDLISKDDNYLTIHSWDNARWQKHIDILQEYVLAVPLADNDELIYIEYVSGLILQVRKDYLHLDDHELETQIFNRFGFLMPRKKGGGLKQYVVDTVLTECPQLLPKDFLLTLERLLSVDLD
ncbi:recombination protein F [Pseudomonas sp. 31 E 6]|uniref:AAA family ATPase n=1 Tax=unclassified Pseudomonas TaxID=196821 RepID=UPI000811DF50|nr:MULTISPECIES: AAA family ATPase [unclassified Pseudomonas]CRM14808.1 recombination protein F [Pseudomonas sp. 31 E 5]CRM23889.1 recombination protein F [Pseudomonas sp. 31 E 6]